MKIYATRPFEVYEVSDQELRIHWNISETVKEDGDGNISIRAESDEALCFITDSRSVLIEKIIRTVYDIDTENYLINNKEENTEEYAKYQELVILSEILADGWLDKD